MTYNLIGINTFSVLFDGEVDRQIICLRDGGYNPNDETSIEAALTATRAEASSPANLDEVKRQELGNLSTVRYHVEISGILWNSHPLQTTRDAQQAMTRARQNVDNGGTITKWKFADGVFRRISNADLLAMDEAVRAHVATAFDIEETITAQINGASTIEDAQGWAWPQAGR